MRIRDTLSAEFARLCYYGFWYAPEMDLIMNSINFSQKNVTGGVELKLYKGNVIVTGRESPVPCTVQIWLPWTLKMAVKAWSTTLWMLKASFASML
mmetsp:Transcript_26708/g.36732  ORF Transcript_26708/g.36732 Transcript_26708/m.36732 type:complete len:96 (+) Transcript_26708:918-1205(+)